MRLPAHKKCLISIEFLICKYIKHFNCWKKEISEWKTTIHKLGIAEINFKIAKTHTAEIDRNYE